MKNIKMTVIGLLVLMCFLSCSSDKSGKVLAEINGVKITEGDIDFLGTINPRISAQLMTPAGKKKILDNIVEQELLYQEAVKQGINDNKDVKAKADLYRRVIVAQALVDDEMEKTIKKYYDDNKNEFEKLTLAHIMVKYANPEDLKKAKKDKNKNKDTVIRSEAEALELANQIKARLDKGEKFADLAKEYSDDLTTKNKGGDLGPTCKNETRLESKGYGPLLEKAFTMKVSEISGPIKTNSGYHLVTVTEGIELMPYDQAKNMIAFKIRGTAKDDLVAKLKSGSSIKYTEDETQKPAEPPAAMSKTLTEMKQPPTIVTPNIKQVIKKEPPATAKKDTKPVTKKQDTKKK